MLECEVRQRPWNAKEVVHSRVMNIRPLECEFLESSLAAVWTLRKFIAVLVMETAASKCELLQGGNDEYRGLESAVPALAVPLLEVERA